MKRAWPSWGAVVFLVGGAWGMGAEPPVRVVAVPPPLTPTVGEVFTVELRTEGPPGISWEFPAEVVTPAATLRLEGEPSGGNVRRYRAALFVLEDAAIPPVTVRYRLADGRSGEVTSEPVPVSVASLLSNDPDGQRLAELRPPVSLPAGAPFWITLGLLFAGVAGGAAWWWRRRRAPLAESAVPEVPPDEEARAALQRLAASGLLERGDLRAFYIELAIIAKRYLKRRLQAPVLEMTSTETAAFLRDHPVGRRVAGSVRELNAAADYVKFAHGQGETERARRHWEGVRELVEELERALTPPPVPAAGEGSA